MTYTIADRRRVRPFFNVIKTSLRFFLLFFFVSRSLLSRVCFFMRIIHTVPAGGRRDVVRAYRARPAEPGHPESGWCSAGRRATTRSLGRPATSVEVRTHALTVWCTTAVLLPRRNKFEGQILMSIVRFFCFFFNLKSRKKIKYTVERQVLQCLFGGGICFFRKGFDFFFFFL